MGYLVSAMRAVCPQTAVCVLKSQSLAPAWLPARHFCSFSSSGRCWSCFLIPFHLIGVLFSLLYFIFHFLFKTEVM